MKRIIFLLFVSMFLTSCSSVSQNKFIEKNNTKPSIQDYCPFMGNIKISYSSKGSDIGKKDIYIDYIKNNRIQLRSVTPSQTSVQVIEVKDGELRLIASKNDFGYRDSLLASQNSQPEVLLKEPLEKGTSWTLPDGRKRYISGVDVDVELPLGDFKALEVATEDGKNITYDYYAINLGPIKSVYKNNGTTIESYVDAIESNSEFNQTIKVYYPVSTGVFFYTKKKTSFKTNEELKDKFEIYFKTPLDKYTPGLISSKTQINKLYLNSDDHKVMVDFNAEFKKYLSSLPSLENEIIQSIVNSLGDYYNTDKVYITVEGDEYVPVSFKMNDSNVFYVNYKNIREHK